MATAAERQRRSRAHRGGDHSLCMPDRCPSALEPAALDELLEPPSPSVDESAIAMLGPRGAALWAELAEALGPLHRALLLEACRTTDRLDRLDAILSGREDWLRLDAFDAGSEVRIRVTVDGVLSEARQQAGALRGMVAEIRAVQATKDRRRPPTEPSKSGGPHGDLLARIAARRAGTAG